MSKRGGIPTIHATENEALAVIGWITSSLDEGFRTRDM